MMMLVERFVPVLLENFTKRIQCCLPWSSIAFKNTEKWSPSKDIPTSAGLTTITSNANSKSVTVPNPTMTHWHPTSITSLSFVQTDTLNTVLETEDDKGVLKEENDDEKTNKAFQILDKMENGQILDESLPRISAEDVAFDMDEIIIDEEDYYTDGISDSDASSKDSVEDFEL